MEPTFTPVKDPVGVFYHAKYNMLLVSSLAGDGVVLAYDLKGGLAKSGNLPILRRFTANGVNHFAGMYASSEHLYVLEQVSAVLQIVQQSLWRRSRTLAIRSSGEEEEGQGR
ncbi:MAG: hypothetical protein SGPRY_002045 [Prymnesium sp.]